MSSFKYWLLDEWEFNLIQYMKSNGIYSAESFISYTKTFEEFEEYKKSKIFNSFVENNSDILAKVLIEALKNNNCGYSVLHEDILNSIITKENFDQSLSGLREKVDQIIATENNHNFVKKSDYDNLYDSYKKLDEEKKNLDIEIDELKTSQKTAIEAQAREFNALITEKDKINAKYIALEAKLEKRDKECEELRAEVEKLRKQLETTPGVPEVQNGKANIFDIPEKNIPLTVTRENLPAYFEKIKNIDAFRNFIANNGQSLTDDKINKYCKQLKNRFIGDIEELNLEDYGRIEDVVDAFLRCPLESLQDVVKSIINGYSVCESDNERASIQELQKIINDYLESLGYFTYNLTVDSKMQDKDYEKYKVISGTSDQVKRILSPAYGIRFVRKQGKIEERCQPGQVINY